MVVFRFWTSKFRSSYFPRLKKLDVLTARRCPSSPRRSRPLSSSACNRVVLPGLLRSIPMKQTPPDVDVESCKSSAKQRLETNPTCNRQLHHQHDKIVNSPSRTECIESTLPISGPSCVTLCDSLACVLSVHKMPSRPILVKYQTYRYDLSADEMNGVSHLLQLRDRFLSQFTIPFRTLFRAAFHVVAP